MMKDLERIQKRSKEIIGDYPGKRAELTAKLADIDKRIRQAKEAVESAEDLKTYDKATDVLKRAELEKKFIKSALDKLEAAPRMNEAEYFQTLNICKSIMENATGLYRSSAAGLMAQLKEIHDEYKQIAADVNNTLKMLDESANVLQSKYSYRVKRYQGLPDQKKLDRSAWLEYALRYEPATVCTMATECDPEFKEEHFKHDSVLVAAWGAIERGYPREIF